MVSVFMSSRAITPHIPGLIWQSAPASLNYMSILAPARPVSFYLSTACYDITQHAMIDDEICLYLGNKPFI